MICAILIYVAITHLMGTEKALLYFSRKFCFCIDQKCLFVIQKMWVEDWNREAGIDASRNSRGDEFDICHYVLF